MGERDKYFDLEQFEISRIFSTDKSIIRQEEDEVKDLFYRFLFLVRPERFLFNDSFYDGVSNHTGYEWYELMDDTKLEEAVVTLSNILKWKKHHDISWISGKLAIGNSIYIGMYRCLIECNEISVPSKGTESYERIKKLCEEYEILILEKNIYIDVITGQKYSIKEQSYPGSVDDAATYLSVGLEKVHGKVLDLEKVNNCKELKFKWRSKYFNRLLFVYQKACMDEEIKDYLIRLEDEVIKEAKKKCMSSTISVQEGKEAKPINYEKLSDNDKEEFIHEITKDRFNFVFDHSTHEIIVDLKDNAESITGGIILSLLETFELSFESDYYNKKRWQLVYRIENENKTSLSRWEMLILKLYPLIEKVIYVEKDKYIRPKYVQDKRLSILDRLSIREKKLLKSFIAIYIILSLIIILWKVLEWL